MNMQVTPHPIMPDAVDLLLLVGQEYAVPQYIREAKSFGMSKRIPSKSIPHGIVPGVSRLFLWHSQVIPLVRVEGQSMFDLTTRLINMGKLDQDTARILNLDERWKPTDLLLPDSYVPPSILRLTCIIQDLSPIERRQIEKDFEIEWQGAVFSFSYLDKPQCVVDANGNVPDEIADKYGDELDYVRVEYTDENPQATPLDWEEE